MSLGHDLHLSAAKISRDGVRHVEQLGFQRDEFANNTRCATCAYHGTYRGGASLPNDELWQAICDVLRSDDPDFEGALEEESFAPWQIVKFETGEPGPAKLLPPIPIADCPPGAHKACDIHIGIELSLSRAVALACLEALQIASFDRPSPSGLRRVFTITSESASAGASMFRFLETYLSGTPGLVGKMKMESTTRFLRLPDSATLLPITSTSAASTWLDAVGAAG